MSRGRGTHPDEISFQAAHYNVMAGYDNHVGYDKTLEQIIRIPTDHRVTLDVNDI